MWRIFATEADCQTWCDSQFVAMVRARAGDNGGIMFDHAAARRPVDIRPLPDRAITPARFPLWGRNAATGRWNSVDGFTTAWATPQQTADGRWAAPCRQPDDPDGQPEPEWPTLPDLLP